MIDGVVPRILAEDPSHPQPDKYKECCYLRSVCLPSAEYEPVNIPVSVMIHAPTKLSTNDEHPNPSSIMC
jgi:hypothetical protein